MKTSRTAITLMEELEGFRSTLYKDAGGKATVGFGHLVKPGESFTRITFKEGEDLLARDLQAVENAINSLVAVPLTQNQFDALASLVFNIGSGNFAKSTLLKRLNVRKYSEAAEQFTRWVMVNGKPLPGLVRRRKIERALFLKTIEQDI